MIAYHGFNTEKFVIEKHINSRYGFPCLFFTNDKKLALNYSNDENKIIEILLFPEKTIDFKSNVSYSLNFRNLIYQLRNESLNVVEIKNVYDRPNDSFELIKSSIFVVFNFDKINL